jgi:hypothetical protein
MGRTRRIIHTEEEYMPGRIGNHVNTRRRPAVPGWRLAGGLGGAMVLLGLTVATVAAASLAQEGQANDASIWPVLVPFMTAAVSVERIIELGWNYIEWGMLRFAGWQQDDLKLPTYVHFKSGTSLLAGVVLGVLLSNYTGMRLLALLRPASGFDVLNTLSPSWDIVLTGIIVGAGAKPAHDILALITQVKNFFENNALKQRELAGAALAESIQRLGQANAPYTVDVPGIGPTSVGSGSARMARNRMAADIHHAAPEDSPSLEDYANLIHKKLRS